MVDLTEGQKAAGMTQADINKIWSKKSDRNKYYRLQMQRLLQAKTYAARKQAQGKKKKRSSTDYNRSTQVYNVKGGFW